MAFSDLTDEEWDKVRVLIPSGQEEGRPRTDDRRTLNAILFVLKERIPWNYLPKEYGDDSTANRRFKEWQKEGVWERITETLGMAQEPNFNSELQFTTAFSGACVKARHR